MRRLFHTIILLALSFGVCGYSDRGEVLSSSTIGSSTPTCGGKLGGGAAQPFWMDNSCLNVVYDCSGGTGSQTIGTVASSVLPTGFFVRWAWPLRTTFQVADICGAGRMTLGLQFGGNSAGVSPPASTPAPTPLAIDSISSLTATFNVKLIDQKQFNGGYEEFFFEMYPANASGSGVTLSREVSLNLHIDAGSFAFYGPGGTCGASCTISANYNGTAGCPFTGYATFVPGNTSGGNTGGQIIMMSRDGSDFLHGCFDIKDIFAFLEAQGMLPSGKFLNGIEFMSENIANSGSWSINCIGYDWNGTQYGAAAC